MLDQISLPFGFGETQAANLSTWRGEPDHPQWKLVLAALERAMGQAGKPEPRPTPPPKQPGWNAALGGALPAETSGKKTNWKLWAGIGAGIVVVLGLIGAGLDNTGPPSPPVPPIDNPSSPGVAVPPQVEAVLQQARAAQAAGRAAADQGAQAAQAGNAAAMQAQQGKIGFGQTQLNPVTLVVGDLAAFQQGRQGAVIVRNTQMGTTFTGMVEIDPGTGMIRAMTGAVDNGRGGSGLGRTLIKGQNMQSSGRDSTPAYTAEGSGQGVSGSFESSVIGVITFADGHRYEGQYISRGQDANVFRHGLGATYGFNGALVEAGRYEMDKLTGPY
jgi:hypothetical protein